MRKRDFIIFFSVVFTIYGLINFYIFNSGLSATSPELWVWYPIVFWSLALSLIAGRFLERVFLSWLSSILVWIGSFRRGNMGTPVRTGNRPEIVQVQLSFSTSP